MISRKAFSPCYMFCIFVIIQAFMSLIMQYHVHVGVNYTWISIFRSDLAAQGLVRPMIYRGPGGAPVIGLQMAAGAVRPAGLLPPGPPPGLPPAMRMHRLPGGMTQVFIFLMHVYIL